jgi:hypothetical protein
VGLNETFTVHVALMPSDTPQSLVPLKSVVNEMLLIDIAILPELETFTTCEELVLPTA